MEIRKLQSKDLSQAMEVLRSHQKEIYYKTFGLDWSEKQMEESLGHFVLGLFQEKLAAFIAFRGVHESLFELDLMVTHKDMTHKNYMRVLFEESRRQLPPRCEIWLEVHQNNSEAQNFYFKQGFQKVGERPKYYPDGGAAILMSFKP
jgi:ribosomal-protein-alanine N-acetyltransferase